MSIETYVACCEQERVAQALIRAALALACPDCRARPMSYCEALEELGKAAAAYRAVHPGAGRDGDV